jgi:apolipoprotein N-acyltransferase
VRLVSVAAMREQAASVRMGVVQPNVSMDDKKDSTLRGDHLARMQRMSALLEKDGAEIVIWPESAYPYTLDRTVREDRAGDRKIVRGFSVPLVFGAVSRDRAGLYNSAFLVTPGGEISEPVDKNHLVLFSENPPFRDLWPESMTRKYRFLQAGFQPGSSPGVLTSGDARMGVLICLEDIKPDFGREVVAAGANVLVNMTNDAWFGDTAEPEQHLALAVFRSVETRRDLVRSVNTGISAFIHATGEVEVRTGTFEQSRFVADVRLLETTTVFARAGNWVGWVCMGALVMMGVWTTIRRRRIRRVPEVVDDK